jgi:hypothetical protein
MTASLLPLVDFSIGIVVLFLGFSLMVSALVEMLRQAMDAREKSFDKALTALCRASPDLKRCLQSETLLAAFGTFTKVAHVPPETFAKAVLGWINAQGGRAAPGADPIIWQVLNAQPAVEDAEAQTKQDLAALETWYRAAMDRASESFRKRSQRWLFAIGLLAAISVDFDAVRVAKALYLNPAVSAALAEQVSSCAKANPDTPTACAPSFNQLIADGQLPLGLVVKPDEWVPCAIWRRITEGGLIGWIIAAISAVVGAQVWFDALKRLINLRTSGIETRPDK